MLSLEQLYHVGPQMVYQALFDHEGFLQNEEIHNFVHPLVQQISPLVQRDDGRNPFSYLPSSIRNNGIIQEAEKDDQYIIDGIDGEARQIRNWVDDYEHTGNYGEEVKELDDDIQGIEKELYEDFEEEVDVRQLWKKSDTIWNFFMVFRWLLNLVVVGFPWTFISQIFFAWNVLFNAKWNFLWAGGNVYLVANTVFAYIQTWMSVFVIWEVPFYMRHFKFFRLISLVTGLVYNILYYSSVADFLALLFYYDKDTFDIFYLMEAMFFGYNIVLHFPITIVNTVIAVKETMMEMFQFSSKKHGHNVDLALGLFDIWSFWSTVLSVINPMNYLRFARKELYDKLYKKYVMKK